MSGDNAVVGRPGRIGLPASGSCWRTSIVTAVRDITLSPDIPHLRTVSASDMHATEIAPRPGAIVPLASASPYRPALMVISFSERTRASMNHVHPLLPAVCINHLTMRSIIREGAGPSSRHRN
jgi:hypothetical protein